MWTTTTSSRKTAAPTTQAAFVVLLVLVAHETAVVPVAEARVCKGNSGLFKGMCMSDTNCAEICFSEGWTGGKCDGVPPLRRCVCTKQC